MRRARRPGRAGRATLITVDDRAFLEAAGRRIEYRWVGPSPDCAPTLVFLHEGLGCAALWRDFPDRLAARTGCGAFVYSRAGYGRSTAVPLPRPLSYMHDEAQHHLGPTLDAAGIRRALLVGHSDGASIATIYAAVTADDRVVGLALLAPHFFNEDVCVASIRQAKAAFETSDLRERLARYHGDNVDCAFWGWNRAWLDPAFRHWNIEQYIPRIRVPVLLVQGENDQYGTRRQLDAFVRGATCPVETRLLAGSRHAPFIDQPQATLEILVRFIAAACGNAQRAVDDAP